MNDITMTNARILCENAVNASSVFVWQGQLHAVAFAAAMGTDRVDVQRAKAAKKTVSSRTGFLSSLGSSATQCITASAVCKSDDPDRTIEEIKEIYKIVKKRFWGNEYSALASVILYNSGKDIGTVVENMDQIHKLMKKDHFFYSSSEDTATYAIMALSGKSPEYLEEETERCYKTLKPYFFDHNDLLTLSCLLSIYDEPYDVKCRRVVELRDGLKKKGLKISGYSSAAILAPLVKASFGHDVNALISEVVETERYLSTKKIFGGILGIGKSMRVMFSCAVVSNSLGDAEDSVTNAMAASVTAIVTEEVVMTACMCACIASSTAAASSTSCS